MRQRFADGRPRIMMDLVFFAGMLFVTPLFTSFYPNA